MTTATPTAQSWGKLSEPIRSDAAGVDDPIWKDNAYLSFWDSDAAVFGTVHVSTSPNAPDTRRARFSVSVAGRVTEVVETLEVGTFSSESIHFGLDGRVRVEHPLVSAELVNAPLFAAADYAANDAIPALGSAAPLQHFQQACTVTGNVTVDGTTVATAGRGMRDRTWGFRDESSQWVEFAALFAVDESAFVTAMKFRHTDDSLTADGFVIDSAGSTAITGITFARDAAAQFRWARLRLEDDTTRLVSLSARLGGFRVPAGPAETDGPALGVYDDFLSFDTDGRGGEGIFEQAILHRVA
ncbi:hypothetical protein NLM24_20250 [Nocardia zapadnayensis]|uniref:DUF7065 domain-containing protein n=1 Tax=Nocardia rhamnosiphila TaxID=426716 RepID=UPI0022459303|nr:hypothetical protein [Nocardia zapadnayensis]MCX0272995.1 hypothetical protein [Nocardia zapadnayensis]